MTKFPKPENKQITTIQSTAAPSFQSSKERDRETFEKNENLKRKILSETLHSRNSTSMPDLLHRQSSSPGGYRERSVDEPSASQNDQNQLTFVAGKTHPSSIDEVDESNEISRAPENFQKRVQFEEVHEIHETYYEVRVDDAFGESSTDFDGGEGSPSFVHEVQVEMPPPTPMKRKSKDSSFQTFKNEEMDVETELLQLVETQTKLNSNKDEMPAFTRFDSFDIQEEMKFKSVHEGNGFANNEVSSDLYDLSEVDTPEAIQNKSSYFENGTPSKELPATQSDSKYSEGSTAKNRASQNEPQDVDITIVEIPDEQALEIENDLTTEIPGVVPPPVRPRKKWNMQRSSNVEISDEMKPIFEKEVEHKPSEDEQMPNKILAEFEMVKIKGASKTSHHISNEKIDPPPTDSEDSFVSAESVEVQVVPKSILKTSEATGAQKKITFQNQPHTISNRSTSFSASDDEEDVWSQIDQHRFHLSRNVDVPPPLPKTPPPTEEEEDERQFTFA